MPIWQVTAEIFTGRHLGNFRSGTVLGPSLRLFANAPMDGISALFPHALARCIPGGRAALSSGLRWG